MSVKWLSEGHNDGMPNSSIELATFQSPPGALSTELRTLPYKLWDAVQFKKKLLIILFMIYTVSDLRGGGLGPIPLLMWWVLMTFF